MKKVQTVLGPIATEDVGVTLTHEHFSLNFDHFYVPPPENINERIGNQIVLENVGFVRQYPYGSRYNLQFSDEDTHRAVIEDVKAFKNCGGGTIVENTSIGLDKNVRLSRDIARETGVNIVVGTGHYIESVQSDRWKAGMSSVERMVELYTRELNRGCIGFEGGPRAGFIGEVGSVWPITDFEKRAIQATGEVQASLGCPVSFHPGRDPQAPFEIVRIYLEAGGRADKCVMSHLDRTIFDDAALLNFADLGTYCQFDLFGTECSYYQLNPATDMPSDGIRLDRLAKLITEGKDRILLSHDIHTKHRLTNFGGHGYAHILTNVLPRFKYRDVSDEMVHKITVTNPGEWLEYEALDFPPKN